jgi:hypothetical protein
MQSDDRSARALSALARPREMFRSAVIDAIEELTVYLAQQRAPAESRAEHESVRLGVFAAGHIDVERFSQLVSAGESLDPVRLDALEHALRILRGFAAQGDDLHRVTVRRGADLRDSLRDALATRGRAFNTAHHIEILRTGRTGARAELEYGTLDFRHWTRMERTVAPPLVAAVSGADVQAAGLAEYMDGGQKIVLIVDGPMAPAPLARLVAPAAFVMQTHDVSAIERLAAFDGPGIAAVVPDSPLVALFTHDPTGGPVLSQRLSIERLPEAPRRGVAGGSVRQQVEELAWLAELARLAVPPAAATDAATDGQKPVPAVTPADQLAAWLLSRTDLAIAE